MVVFEIYFFFILWSRSCFYSNDNCAYQSLNWFRKLKVILLVFSISSNLIKRWITFQELQWQQEISNNYSVPDNLNVLQQLSLNSANCVKVKVDSWPSFELTIMDLSKIPQNEHDFLTLSNNWWGSWWDCRFWNNLVDTCLLFVPQGYQVGYSLVWQLI